jgi:hypothetical protein
MPIREVDWHGNLQRGEGIGCDKQNSVTNRKPEVSWPEHQGQAPLIVSEGSTFRLARGETFLMPRILIDSTP